MPQKPASRMTDRVVIVTGAGGGIGEATCRRLTEEGAIVLAADLREPVHSHYAGHIAFDVTSANEWRAAIDRSLAAHGRIDGLVLAHGIVGAEAPVGEYPADVWDEVMRINATGCFLGLAATLPAMARGGGGRVAVLASIVGREPNANQSAYSASKAATIALVKSSAREYARFGIFVNAIAPSIVETSLAGQLSAEFRAELLAKVPLGRFALPDEAAALAMYLLSDELSYTTGQVFDLSGGRSQSW